MIALALMIVGKTAYGQDFLEKENLRLNWVFYDESEKVMLPFLENSNNRPVAIYLSTELNIGKEAYLMIEIPGNTSLFVDGKYIDHFDVTTVKYFGLDSLAREIGSDKFQLTLYNKESFETRPEARIGFKHKSFDSSINVNPITQRNIDERGDYLKIIILLVFAFFALLYALFPYELMDFYNFHAIITFRLTDTAINRYRSITKIQILIIVFQASLLASLLIIAFNYYYDPIIPGFFMELNPIIGWLILFGIVIILIFLKSVLISVISMLFGIADRVNFYFIEFLRMAMIFYSIIFIALSYAIINRLYLVPGLLNVVIIMVIVFNLIRFLILFFKFHRNISMKSLHLFSYLCTTELVPILIGLKFFIK